MAEELAFVLLNPYTLGKSRTGGVIGRIISKTGLEVVAARMYGPSNELVEKYAELIQADEKRDGREDTILADYVRRAYAPNPKTGARKRVMMLLFKGEDAIEKIRKVTGNVHYNMGSAKTVRDIYGDYIVDSEGRLIYVEPAVLIGPDADSVKNTLKLWAEYSEQDGGLIEDSVDLEGHESIEHTLVLIKPDNFKFPSARPGGILTIFSESGLRIIGAKVHRMSVADALEFYGPVQDVLRKKLTDKAGERAATALEEEFAMDIPADVKTQLGQLIGPLYGDQQFYEIVKFMTGRWAPDCEDARKAERGDERCLALVYAGPNAVEIIRGILGPTDPSKALPGSVRKEYGQDVMVNAAHASDSPENAAREMGIVKVDEDRIQYWYEKYFAEKGE